MGYQNLQACIEDLKKNGHLLQIDYPLNPDQEIAAIQRRAFAASSPALLFTNPVGCRFPMLGNLFGTRERVNFIFRDTLESIKTIFGAVPSPASLLRKPLKSIKSIFHLKNLLPHRKPAWRVPTPVLDLSCSLSELPMLKSWPQDGGAFITLPLVYSENCKGKGNLGMYRVQLSGNRYAFNEAGMHYQLKRGIGIHHAEALRENRKLPVHVYVGGAPALTLAAIMPLPEGMDEIMFAGFLGGNRICQATKPGFPLPIITEADFLIKGYIDNTLKPEGPFGDHMGYYSLEHEFPVLKVEKIYHRKNAIWPFTTVGRPPQEDTIFGDIIHELTTPMVGQVFPGIREVHAVDAAGVHPLLLAIGQERYVPYENIRRPRELLSHGLHLLGATQTSLAKYLLITAYEDNPELSTRNVPEFFAHILERTDFSSDLRFLANVNCDTLDYTGTTLNEGSKLLWASAGPKVRNLGNELRDFPPLPDGFKNPQLFAPGIIVLKGPPHLLNACETDTLLEKGLCSCLGNWSLANCFPLVVVVDDVAFSCANWDNFLWTVFSKSSPGADVYGANAVTVARHWRCTAPLVIDARKKRFHAPELEEDPAVTKRIENLAIRGGPLYGLF